MSDHTDRELGMHRNITRRDFLARKTFGRIAIANADAGAYAYTDEAINQAWRAVGELKV